MSVSTWFGRQELIRYVMVWKMHYSLSRLCAMYISYDMLHKAKQFLLNQPRCRLSVPTFPHTKVEDMSAKCILCACLFVTATAVIHGSITGLYTK